MDSQGTQPALFNRNPQISVIMPTYNQCEYLEKAIQSVLAQTWTDYEFIIVNDGSTDSTCNILYDFQEKYDQIRVIDQENKKLPEALNTGFRHAKGKFLTWTSSDNYMHPEMLKTLYHELVKDPHIGLVYADWELIDEKDRVIKKITTFDYDKYLLMRVNYINCCFLYRRECQDTVGYYDDNFRYAEDWEYWLRIASKFNIKHIRGCYYQYRIHQKSLTSTIVLQKSVSKPGRIRLLKKLKSHLLPWYWSKIKFLLLTLKLGEDPKKRFLPDQ